MDSASEADPELPRPPRLEPYPQYPPWPAGKFTGCGGGGPHGAAFMLLGGGGPRGALSIPPASEADPELPRPPRLEPYPQYPPWPAGKFTGCGGGGPHGAAFMLLGGGGPRGTIIPTVHHRELPETGDVRACRASWLGFTAAGLVRALKLQLGKDILFLVVRHRARDELGQLITGQWLLAVALLLEAPGRHDTHGARRKWLGNAADDWRARALLQADRVRASYRDSLSITKPDGRSGTHC